MSQRQTFPSLFVSHGTPMMALAEDDFTASLKTFVQSLPARPKAVVVLSAHGTSQQGIVEISAATRNSAAYDFKGFPRELYQIDYNSPGNPQLATEVAGYLAAEGFQTELNTNGEMDHGVWIPLRVMFPDADIPVVQVTIPFPGDPKEILKMGRALAPLRGQGILLMGSGGAVHNLEKLEWHEKDSDSDEWAKEFQNWLIQALATKNVETLLNFEEAPHAAVAHPTHEHFLPVLFTIGTALPGDKAVPVYEQFQYKSLSMLTFALRGGESDDK